MYIAASCDFFKLTTATANADVVGFLKAQLAVGRSVSALTLIVPLFGCGRCADPRIAQAPIPHRPRPHNGTIADTPAHWLLWWFVRYRLKIRQNTCIFRLGMFLYACDIGVVF